MKIGIIGDIHAEDMILEIVLGFLSGKKADRILCVGDIVDGTGDANRCFDLLREANAIIVAGNHERWLIEDDAIRSWPDATDLNSMTPENLELIRSLPATKRLKTPIGPTLLCHGLGENDMAMLQPFDEGYAIEFNTDLQTLLAENRYKYVIAGHSHQPMFRRFGPMAFINPGALIYEPFPSFVIIDFDLRELRFYKLDYGGNVRERRFHWLD